jgi:hypothetical protein
MATVPRSMHDDRLIPYTRYLSAFIVPFLLLGFVLLYLLPADTKQLFAWTIKPTMTAMVMASAYLGGAYFFVRVLRESRWHVVKTGLLAVTLFASLLGVATVLHWDTFNHRHVAFWIWAGLYFTTPFLVLASWLANRRFAAPVTPGEPRVSDPVRWVVGLIGALSLLQGIVMFGATDSVIPIWPWVLTPLTCRVLGAVFCLGSAGLSVVSDARWSSLRLMLQVESMMVALMLIAAVRAHDQFNTGRPLTWILLAGFLAVLLGSIGLWFAMEIRPRHPTDPVTAKATSP